MGERPLSLKIISVPGPQISSGRHEEPERWYDQRVYDPEAKVFLHYLCRVCDEPNQYPYRFYCCKEHKEAWERNVLGPNWPTVRELIKERDNHTCQICGVTQDELTQRSLETDDYFFSEFSLEVDHIKPVKTHPHLEFVQSNLRTLCHDCHAKHGANPRSRPKAPPPGQPRLHDYEEVV